MRRILSVSVPIMLAAVGFSMGGCPADGTNELLSDLGGLLGQAGTTDTTESTASSDASGTTDAATTTATSSSDDAVSGSDSATTDDGDEVEPNLPVVDDADLAVAQFMPETVELPVDEMTTNTDDVLDDKTLESARPFEGRPSDRIGRARHSESITHTGWLVNEAQRIAGYNFRIARQIAQDLNDPNQPNVAGELRLWRRSYAYKADFSAFDIDGDGVDDGSGTPGTLPVAFRIWVDKGDGYEQYMCGLIVARPSPERSGAGTVFGRPWAVDRAADPNLHYKLDWDHQDATHKWNEVDVAGMLLGAFDLAGGVHRVDRRDVGAETQRSTVRAHTIYNSSPQEFDEYNFIGHYELGSSAILTSLTVALGPIEMGADNQCINLETRELDETGLCDEFDLQDYAYLPDPAAEDAAFPAAFPTEPTF